MGQVLMDFNTRAFADRYDISEEDKALLIYELFKSNANWSLCDWGYLTEAEVAELACKRLPERLHSIACEIATRWWDPIIPIEGMADVVRRVKEKGFGLYLLSNAGSTHRTYWQLVPGHEYFDGVLISSYEKLSKPQPEIYQLLLKRFGLKPEECLFTDDVPLNLAGAQICGMKTLAFTTAERFLSDVKELGIEL